MTRVGSQRHKKELQGTYIQRSSVALPHVLFDKVNHRPDCRFQVILCLFSL